MQNAILVSELYAEYTIYFPKCYRYFIKDDYTPNDRFLIVLDNNVRYEHSAEEIYIDELEDLSNCYVRLQPNQRHVDYLNHFFQYIIKRYKWTEDMVENVYKKSENE